MSCNLCGEDRVVVRVTSPEVVGGNPKPSETRLLCEPCGIALYVRDEATLRSRCSDFGPHESFLFYVLMVPEECGVVLLNGWTPPEQPELEEMGVIRHEDLHHYLEIEQALASIESGLSPASCEALLAATEEELGKFAEQPGKAIREHFGLDGTNTALIEALHWDGEFAADASGTDYALYLIWRVRERLLNPAAHEPLAEGADLCAAGTA